ncbi:MAG TPA: DUF5067 domain-containing protein [Fastidiosipila sp.]|nr:DUF5067 domain-containing protein [Fastidiosipila sp.]
MMSKKRKTPLLTALVLLIAALFILSNAGMANALVVGETVDQQEEVSENIEYVYEKMANWRERLIVTEYSIWETMVMQAYVIVDSIEEPGMDIEAFSNDLFDMLDELKLPHQRMYLDLVTKSGERLESYDLVAEIKEIETATFDRFRTGAPDPNGQTDPTETSPVGTGDAKVVELNESFTLEDAELKIKAFQVEEDEDGKYVKLWFDYTNNSEEEDSAFMAVDYYGFQGGVELVKHSGLDDDWETTYASVEPGKMMDNCTLAFYLESETEAVTIRFEKFLGDEAAELVLELDAVG